MSTKAKPGAEGFDAITEWVMARFRLNLGAVIERPEGKRIFLIPESVADEKKSGLIIASDAGGCYVFKGDKELNEFVLVSAGFPLHIGVEVSKIVNALIMQYGLLRKSENESTANVELLKLTHEKEKKHG